MQQRDSLLTQNTQIGSGALNDNLINTENKTVQCSQPVKKTRLASLDILRGLTMVGMILVDNSPSPPWYLDHAQWSGVTPADFIFPSFLFIMGMAVPLALTKNNPLSLKTIWRIVALFLIGVLINLSSLRVMGILQRLSLCYGTLSFVHYITNYGQKSSRFIGWLIALFFTSIYCVFMFTYKDNVCTQTMVFTQNCNFGGHFDRSIFGPMHMIYPNDPQGLFTTLTAFLNAFFGYQFSLIMKDYKNDQKKIITFWVIGALILGAISYPLTFLMPFIKKIWSISFVFLTSAVSGASIAFFAYIIDFLGNKNQNYGKIIDKIMRPFTWLGRNPLIVFVMMDAVTILMLKYIIINDRNTYSGFFSSCFSSWIHPKQLASTFFAIFWTLVWITFSGILHRFKIFIKL